MDKKSILGLVIIAVILFGYTWYQGRQSEKIQKERERQDSIYRAQRIAAGDTLSFEDSVKLSEAQPASPDTQAVSGQTIYKDAFLENAHNDKDSLIALENDLLEIVFTTKGAQPYSVRIKDYYNYDSTALYIFKPGNSEYSISAYTGEYINTKDFNFQIASKDDSTLVMRLPFSDGGYIEQSYSLSAGSYNVKNNLSFNGMENIIPKNVSSVDIDVQMTLPRMEKGFKNESQYSKVDFYVNGDKKPVEFGRGRNSKKNIPSSFSWFAFQQQFFSAIVCAPNQFSSGELSVDFCSQDDPERNLMVCAAKMRAELRRGNEVTIPLEFYFGPNSYSTLKSYDRSYEKIIPLGGWGVNWITKFAIIPMFDFFHRFISSFGLVILLMTIVIKIVVLPFTYKSFASSAKMAALRPEMDKLSAKYPKQEDAMKKQQATMDLYKRAGVSPLGGCLPTLLTFPVLWAMFRFFPASIELRQQSFLWCDDLSAYDSILDFGFRIPLLGDHLSLFALLMAVTMWFYSKFTMASQPNPTDPTASSMKFMTLWMMPIMMFFICNNLSAALSYYYLLSQLIAIVQNLLIRRTIDADAILEKVHASEGKPLPKSKFQQRLEAAQKMQQQQMKEQQKKMRR